MPLHLTGSDLCEIFFSKIGGMVGLERAYDFHKLVSTANTLNQLWGIEYGKNGLKFGRMHKKMTNMSAQLHPLGDGEEPCNFGDYSSIASDAHVVAALKEGLKEAQKVLWVLNLAPSVHPREKEWFLKPWNLDQLDPKHLAYKPTRIQDA